MESDLLTDKEQDACTPTDQDLEAYLATSDDAVAARLREKHPEQFRLIGRSILYGLNIAKAQREKTLQP